MLSVIIHDPFLSLACDYPPKKCLPNDTNHTIDVSQSSFHCMRHVLGVKADLKSYIPLETASIFFSSEPFSKTGY